VRIAQATLDALDQLAATEQRTRSDMARILLTEALQRLGDHGTINPP